MTIGMFHGSARHPGRRQFAARDPGRARNSARSFGWVQTAYLLAEIVAIPLTGWITAMLSTRGAFVVCVSGFTAASVACAGSGGFCWLIAARVVQGFCGGS